VNEQPVRFGLVGFGLFGAHHANAVEACDDTKLTAVALPRATSREAAHKAQPDVAICSHYNELVIRDDVDVVSVVAPNKLHYEIAKASLDAGKHVLLEKPMALEVGHCDELVELAQSKGLVLAVGHELRLSSLWSGAKKLIDEGVIGDPLHVLIELSRFPYRQGSEGWRYDIDRVGSWILEEPIHFFDLARWYLSSRGEPISIYARGNSRHAEKPKLLDNFSAMVDFDGAYAVISQTLAAFGHHQTAKITGTQGAIWAWWSAADARSEQSTFGLRYGLGNDVTEVTFDQRTGELLELADEIAAVAKCVRDGTEPPCTGNDGRWSTLLCLAAERSVDVDGPLVIDAFVRDSR